MPFVATIKSGQAICTPDVCKTPAPPGSPIPIPYPNTAMTTLANPPTTKVLVDGAPAVTKSSKLPLSNGDTAGSVGGVVSGTIMGECEWVMASFKVKFEGKPVIRQGDSAKSNKGNAFGSLLQPSQAKVNCN
ncbi:DUF4150 domain-containing protein [Castellaniella sp. S9]|uniref:DUF4150 domain-containing protein n=1 Tax=Castellaniella sp. S9 TaxID=2993652 RepID=UPI0022B479BC|nr:DUF4150 domain-containing protein [Castellaniella sp. S9]